MTLTGCGLWAANVLGGFWSMAVVLSGVCDTLLQNVKNQQFEGLTRGTNIVLCK